MQLLRAAALVAAAMLMLAANVALRDAPAAPSPTAAARRHHVAAPTDTATPGPAASAPADVAPLPDRIQFAAACDDVVVEVGTNTHPDFLDSLAAERAAGRRPCLLGVEPLVPAAAQAACDKSALGPGACVIVPFAVGPTKDPAGDMITMTAAADSKCSSLLQPSRGILKARGRQWENCVTGGDRRRVRLVSLDALLSRLWPPTLPVRVLALDMQGFDVFGASSLRRRALRDRVGNFMFECQDLRPGDDRWLVQGSHPCLAGVDCFEKAWGWWFRGCLRNMAPREFNCILVNLTHPLAQRTIAHPFVGVPRDLFTRKGPRSPGRLEVYAPCPAELNFSRASH